NENQQVITLSFDENEEDSYTVSPPLNTWKARPGYYMLFAVDSSGIPSVAEIVELRDYTHISALSTPTVLTGTAHATMTKEQSFLGDNAYVGGYVTSDAGG